MEINAVDITSKQPLLFANEGISAGFSSLTQDYLGLTIDLNKELIKHPASTFNGHVIEIP